MSSSKAPILSLISPLPNFSVSSKTLWVDCSVGYCFACLASLIWSPNGLSGSILIFTLFLVLFKLSLTLFSKFDLPDAKSFSAFVLNTCALP